MFLARHARAAFTRLQIFFACFLFVFTNFVRLLSIISFAC